MRFFLIVLSNIFFVLAFISGNIVTFLFFMFLCIYTFRKTDYPWYMFFLPLAIINIIFH